MDPRGPVTRLAPPEGWGWIAGSAVLLALAHPPFDLLFPSLVGFVPLALWIARLPPGAEGRSRALRGGFWLGLIYFTLLFYWLFAALVFYTPLAVLAFLLPVLILSGFAAVVVLGVHQTVGRLGWPVWIALPVFWTAAEWLRAHLGPVSFPWMEFGTTLAGYPRLVGAADLVGTRGLTFWLAALNGLVACAWLAWREVEDGGKGEGAEGGERARGPGAGRVGRGAVRLGAGSLTAILALTAALPVGYSLYRWETVDLQPAARVTVLQPNVPESLKMQHEAAADSALRSMTTLLRHEARAAAGEVDLLLLPETVFPLYVEPIPEVGHPGRPEYRGWLEGAARELEAPVLYGAYGAEPAGGGEVRFFNSAFLLRPSGRTAARYDKQRLVPMVERVPFVDPGWVRSLFGSSQEQYFGGASIGRRPGVMSLDGARFGVLVCYESIFADLSRRYRREGADFLVNVTNDAWFGREEPWWSRTSALWQHPAHLVLRAVENRMGVARSANTGISGTVDPLGRFEPRTELFEAAALTATVYTSGERTLFTRWGDWVGTGALLAAAAGALAGGLQGRVGESSP